MVARRDAAARGRRRVGARRMGLPLIGDDWSHVARPPGQPSLPLLLARIILLALTLTLAMALGLENARRRDRVGGYRVGVPLLRDDRDQT